MNEEQQIQRGFNAGYKLEQLDPVLSKTLQQGFTDKEHPYVKGFIAGGKEYVKEVELSKSQEVKKGWKPSQLLKPKPSKNKGKDFGIG